MTTTPEPTAFSRRTLLVSAGVGFGACLADAAAGSPAVAADPSEAIVTTGGPGYSEQGTWSTSGLVGYGGQASRFSVTAGASAEWTAALAAGRYAVAVYKLVHSSSDAQAVVAIESDEGTTLHVLDYTSGTSGWVELGTYAFAGGSGHVKVTRSEAHPGGAPYARASAVRFSPEASRPQASFYVHPHGNDANVGTKTSPLRSLEGARTRVREYLAQSSQSSDIGVYFQGGKYTFTDTVTFDSSDSGRNGHMVRYTNYPGESPIFSAGTIVSGWTAHSGSIMRATVGDLDFRQLYVNGKRAIRARTGTRRLLVEKEANGLTIEKGLLDNTPMDGSVELAVMLQWMHKRLRVVDSYTVVKNGAEYTRAVIAEPEWHAVMNEPQGNRTYLGAHYWVENAYRYLNEPGEWYLDRPQGVLYYWPRPGEAMSAVEVVVPRTETIMRFDGSFDYPVQGIEVSGITFRHTNWVRPNTVGFVDVQANTLIPADLGAAQDPQYRHGQRKDRIPAALQGYAAKGVTVTRNTFELLGGSAINFEIGGENLRIVGNRCVDIAGEAISVGNDANQPADARMWPRAITINNNFIMRAAADYMGGIGIEVFWVDGLEIMHNHVRDVPYTGIAAGWGWSHLDPVTQAKDYRISQNRVENYSMSLTDAGGLYVTGCIYGTGGVMDANYVKGSYRSLDPERVIMGMYFDGASSHWRANNNVVEDVVHWWVGGSSFGEQVKSDLAVSGTYVTSPDVRLTVGTDVTVTDTHVHPDAAWPAAAGEIVQQAGLEPAWQWLEVQPDVELDVTSSSRSVQPGDVNVVSIAVKNNTASPVTATLAFAATMTDVQVNVGSSAINVGPGTVAQVPVQLATSASALDRIVRVPFSLEFGGVRPTIESNITFAIEDTVSEQTVVRPTDTGYSELPQPWLPSGLIGFKGEPTRYTNVAGGTAQWRPTELAEGVYMVAVYKVASGTGDTMARLEIAHLGGVDERLVDFTHDNSGWVSLGHYATHGNQITLRNFRTGGYARASAALFRKRGPLPSEGPSVVDLALETSEGVTVSGRLEAVDKMDLPLRFSIASQGKRGVATILDERTGKLSYAPAPSKRGRDSFVVTVTNGIVATEAQVTVRTRPRDKRNGAPVAQDGSLQVRMGESAMGVLTAIDADGETLQYEIVQGPQRGKVVLNDAATGAFVYTPNPGVSGADTFSFRALDGNSYSDPATFTISISLLMFTTGAQYSETGDWATSSTPGYRDQPTRFSGSKGAVATWAPKLEPGTYMVSVYRLVSGDGDPRSVVEVVHANGTDHHIVDLTSSSAGWLDLGAYKFDNTHTRQLRHLRMATTSGGTPYLRTSAVEFRRS